MAKVRQNFQENQPKSSPEPFMETDVILRPRLKTIDTIKADSEVINSLLYD